MENTKDTARASEVKRLLTCIDNEYQCVISALNEMKASRKRDRFIQKRLDTGVVRHVQLAMLVDTMQASALLAQHLAQKEVRSIVIANTWASILLVDYRMKYAKLLRLVKNIPAQMQQDEIICLMHELIYITQTLHDTIGIEQAVQRIEAILAARLVYDEEEKQ
jgi:hypothetical protein